MERQKPKGPPPVHPFDGIYVVLPPEPDPRSTHVCKPPRGTDIAKGSLWGCHCRKVYELRLPPVSHWREVGWRERRRYWRRVRRGERP